MAKSPTRTPKSAPRQEPSYLALSWKPQHKPDHSEIMAYAEATEQWEIIADIKSIDHVALAEFMVQTTNRQVKLQDTIDELAKALELCLSCNGKLTWEAEQEADVVCRQAKQRKQLSLKIEDEQPRMRLLSRREIEILTWTAYGKTRKEISRILSLSEDTLKEYFGKILRKLNASNKTHAVSIAVALGSISLHLKDIQNMPDDDASPQMGGKGRDESTRKGGAE